MKDWIPQTLIVLVIAIVALLATLRVGAFEGEPVTEAKRTIEIAQAQQVAELERAHRQQTADIEQERERTLAPLVTLTQGFITLSPMLFSMGLVMLMAYLAHAWANTIRPDANGLYPIDRKHIAALAQAVALAYHETQFVKAESSGVPHSLTYAPRILNGRHAEEVPTPNDAPMLPVPTFASLLKAGEVGSGRPLVLGYKDGQAIRGTFKDLLSVGIGGLPGSGKTSLVRMLASQIALIGGKLLVIDPHLGAGEDSLGDTLAPLAPALLAAVATSERAIVSVSKLARRKLQERLSGKDKSMWPLVVCVDEFTALMGRGVIKEPLAALLEAIAQEGRKKNVFMLASGQIWSATRTGGTELRSSLASCYCLRLQRPQARMLLQVPSRELPDTYRLPTGQGYFLNAVGELNLVSLPLCTAEDVSTIAGLLGKPATSVVTTMPSLEAAQVADRSGDHSGAQVATEAVFTEREQQILDLIRGGTSQREVIKQVFNASGGQAYTKAAQEVTVTLQKFISTHQ